MHFCLQYDEWKEEYVSLDAYQRTGQVDPTGEIAVRLELLSRKMEMVKQTCIKTDGYLADYLFRSVTKGDTYVTFEAEGAPFGRDMFYDRLRRYFWLLDKVRE